MLLVYITVYEYAREYGRTPRHHNQNSAWHGMNGMIGHAFGFVSSPLPDFSLT